MYDLIDVSFQNKVNNVTFFLYYELVGDKGIFKIQFSVEEGMNYSKEDIAKIALSEFEEFQKRSKERTGGTIYRTPLYIERKAEICDIIHMTLSDKRDQVDKTMYEDDKVANAYMEISMKAREEVKQFKEDLKDSQKTVSDLKSRMENFEKEYADILKSK